MRLSDRLELVISFVREGSSAADIGTDHGYVPIVLAEREIVRKAYAMDVREGPLSRARDHIRAHGLEGQIETRLSDGTASLREGEADTVIAAGMGGELIVHILKEGRRLWDQIDSWILSPQSEPEKVRRFLQEHGFAICREAMVCEDGKYYVVMEAKRGRMERLTEEEALYGPCLIRDRDPVLRSLLEREEKVLSGILAGLKEQTGDGAAARGKQLEKRLEAVRRLLADGKD